MQQPAAGFGATVEKQAQGAPESQDREATIAHYKKAYEQAQSFIASIDLAYSVTVDLVDVWDFDAEEEDGEEAVVLSFTHADDPRLSWTMSVGDDEYLSDGQFEHVVRSIYAEKRATIPEDELPAPMRGDDAHGYEDQKQREYADRPATDRRYAVARERAAKLMQSLDPVYTVQVEEAVMRYPHTETQGTVLAFRNQANPWYSWTMSIGEDDSYIEEQLDRTIQTIYAKKHLAAVRHKAYFDSLTQAMKSRHS
jgi:hypothetical protein